jgi:hypothetical protein
LGLKENVIMGRLIPAGTGTLSYNQVEVGTLAAKHEEHPVLSQATSA